MVTVDTFLLGEADRGRVLHDCLHSLLDRGRCERPARPTSALVLHRPKVLCIGPIHTLTIAIRLVGNSDSTIRGVSVILDFF